MNGLNPAPLKKTRPNGELYTRDSKIETMLPELLSLPREEFVARAKIRSRSDPLYVPSECLLHFVRACRNDTRDTWFERLYGILAERVLRCLPRAEYGAGQTMSLTREKVREEVFGRFVELLAADRESYVERLDYFEIRFDGALANLRRDAQQGAFRDENRSRPLEYDDETGEPSPEVERAAGSYNPFGGPDFEDPAYRSRLEAAIDALPPEQSRIIQMLRQGFPIDSKEPGAVTIASALGRSEKTVRTYRDKAIAALRDAMCQGGAL